MKSEAFALNLYLSFSELDKFSRKNEVGWQISVALKSSEVSELSDDWIETVLQG